jgi:hypothetical protein
MPDGSHRIHDPSDSVSGCVAGVSSASGFLLRTIAVTVTSWRRRSRGDRDRSVI